MHFTSTGAASNGAFAGFGWRPDDRSAADFSATKGLKVEAVNGTGAAVSHRWRTPCVRGGR